MEINNSVTENDIVMLNNVMVGPYQNGIIKKPLTIFGKQALGFEENGEFLNLIINTQINISSCIGKINELLDKLSDCRSELEEFYFANISDWAEPEEQIGLTKKWYDTLKIRSGMIEIPKNGDICLEFECSDCALKDDVFHLRYAASEGFSVWLDD